MRQTWRWFGPADTISIELLPQAGVEGVVSALHHIDNGAVWDAAEISQRQQEIAFASDGKSTGLKWEVVESLPVSEAIKTQTGDWKAHIENYKTSLTNLAEAGLEVVCYNFMPVLDWTRTDLRWQLPNGGTAMRFSLIDFAVFDIHILRREGAAEDYDASIVASALARFEALDEARRQQLQANIIAGLPGANDEWSIDQIRDFLKTYHDIDSDRLRQNLVDFLSEVVPVAEKIGMRLCCHPDDPPFSLLGLPRVMSSPEDYAAVMKAVDSPANGITLCTGSLGVAKDIDFVSFIKDWGHRIHFAHLRNTTRVSPFYGEKVSFFEDEHLAGDTDMPAVVEALLTEEARRRRDGRSDHEIPMRPDHGQELLDDCQRNSMPGYPLIGRMRGLAELRGVMAVLEGRVG